MPLIIGIELWCNLELGELSSEPRCCEFLSNLLMIGSKTSVELSSREIFIMVKVIRFEPFQRDPVEVFQAIELRRLSGAYPLVPPLKNLFTNDDRDP